MMAENTFLAKLKRVSIFMGLSLWGILSVVAIGFILFQAWQLNDLKNKLSQLQAVQVAAPQTALPVVGVVDGTSTDPSNALVTFTDIADVPSQKYINDLASIGFFSGINPGNEFHPYNGITRGEFAEWVFIARNLIRKDDVTKQIRPANPLSPSAFKDVLPTNPYFKYIQALADNGFSVGFGDGTFRPDKLLTREEMIGIKVAVDDKSYEPKDPTQYNEQYSDRAQIDRRFVYYVNNDRYGYCTNVFMRVYGKTNMFKPKQPVLRHEAATAVWNSGCKDAL